MLKNAIFLNKDGTLITDIPYNADPEKIQLENRVIEGLRLLKHNFEFIVITNQPGVALGIMNDEDLQQVKEKIEYLLGLHDISLAGFYYCPHTDDLAITKISCTCRKPLPGLILKAAMENDINLQESWMIGDILNDVEAGKRAGCKSILIDNGHETYWGTGDFRKPDYISPNLEDAARFILNKSA